MPGDADRLGRHRVAVAVVDAPSPVGPDDDRDAQRQLCGRDLAAAAAAAAPRRSAHGGDHARRPARAAAC